MSSDNDNKIHSAHDRFFKRALADKRVAQDFLKHHLSDEIKNLIDFKSLKLEKSSYIDDKLRSGEADVLFSATIGGQLGYFYILVEHQSSVDPLMSLRLLIYIVHIMMDHVKKHGGTELPIVYPMVFYHGESRYTAVTDIFELFGEHKELAKKIFLQPHHLIDVTQIRDEELQKRVWSGTLEFVYKHIYAREFLKHLEGIKPQFRELERKEGENFIMVLLEYVIERVNLDDPKPMVNFIRSTFSQSMEEKAMTLGDRLRAEGYEQGIEQGKYQGIEQDRRAIAVNMLREGCDVDFIVRVTGLESMKIRELQAEHQH